jgi:cardiolipin synthase
VLFVFLSRGRRPVSNILAWLLFIFLVPYIGIPLFLIFGQRKLTWIINKKRQMLNEHRKDAHQSEQPLQHLLNTYGIMPPTKGNELKLLTSGEVAYKTIIEKITTAQKSILISTYVLKNDPTGNGIVDALIIKAKQGIQICLLLDTVGGLFSSPRAHLKELQQAGGQVRHIMPLLHTPFRGRANLRDHRKIMIFDGLTAIMGGMNLALEYMGATPDPQRWIDLSMTIRGAMVEQLHNIFESDWKFSASDQTFKCYRPPKISSLVVGEAELQALASGPDAIGDSLYDSIISSIYNAKEKITIITPYFILDDALQKAFMIAIRRGVKLTIIIPHRSNQHIADYVRSINIRKLRDEGAKIWRCKKMIHAKCFIFDDKLAIAGSANLDLRSLLLNFEISCLLYSPAEIEMLQQWADGLLRECSDQFEKPSLKRVLLEDAAQLLKPLL